MRLMLFMPFAYLSGIEGFAMFAAYAVFVFLVAMLVRKLARRHSAGQSALENSDSGVSTQSDDSARRPTTISWA